MDGPKKSRLLDWSRYLTSESVQGASLPLESIDNVHGCDGLSLGVLGVGDGVTDHVLQENLQNSTGLLIDEAGDTLHTTTASQTPNGRLCDTLDVITENFPMTLSATLSKTLASFAAARHVDCSSAVS